jgi:hypothetical protein
MGFLMASARLSTGASAEGRARCGNVRSRRSIFVQPDDLSLFRYYPAAGSSVNPQRSQKNIDDA